MAEQFALQARFRDCAAVNGYERALPAALFVQQPRRQLLPRACFALDKYRRRRGRDVLDQCPDFPYGSAVPDQPLSRIAHASGRVRGAFTANSIYFCDKFLGRERPQEHIRYAILQRVDSDPGTGVIRDQQGLGRQAVADVNHVTDCGPGALRIDDHEQVEAAMLRQFARFVDRLRTFHGKKMPCEPLSQAGYLGSVTEEKNRRGLGHKYSRCSVRWKARPKPILWVKLSQKHGDHATICCWRRADASERIAFAVRPAFQPEWVQGRITSARGVVAKYVAGF